MALIGTMKYLTIGNQTYEIAGDELQIASASTLGGIKVGNGLSIDATTGVLSTSITETDPTVPSWAKASTKPSYTASEVGAASSSHTHGNITNGGDITATAPTIANGDQIIINDNSASKITNGPTFDGSTTTTALTPKGTWENFSKFSGSYNDLSNKPTIPTVPTVVSAFTNDAGYITSADVPEGASAYTGTISAVSTTASNGTNNGFARGDHVHNITSSTITSALGYTPYDNTNPNGYISSYTDEKLKWTASTTSNTYYPLQSTSTATTSTANTLNGISFYQYYNTAGGYRRLDLGNATAYKSTGGAYGTIRLYGAAATYYGDLVPGVLGTTSGDGHISANRTWTLPDKTGTIALTSDIPTVPTKTSDLTNDSNFVTSSGVTSITLKAGGGISLDTDNTAITSTGTRTISHSDTSSQASSSNNGRTYIQSITLDTYGHVTGISTATETVTNSDTKVSTAAVTSGTSYYPVVGADTTSAATKFYDKTGIVYTGTNGTANGTNGNALLVLGNSTASTTANWKKGTVRLYGTTAYYTDLVSGAPSANRTITFPNATGTVALTSDIPTVPSSTGSATTGISIAAHGTGTVIGVQSSTTTASKVTIGSHSTDYGVKSAGSASTWVFEDVACDDITAWSAGSGSASLTFTMDTTDTKKLKIAFSHSHTTPSLSYTAKTASHVQSGGNGSAPTLGSKVPTVSASDVTVPIKNASASTFVTGTTHTITDNGHVHTI